MFFSINIFLYSSEIFSYDKVSDIFCLLIPSTLEISVAPLHNFFSIRSLYPFNNSSGCKFSLCKFSTKAIVSGVSSLFKIIQGIFVSPAFNVALYLLSPLIIEYCPLSLSLTVNGCLYSISFNRFCQFT